MPHKDQIVFFNIPHKIRPLLNKAMRQGLQKARSFLRIYEPVEMLLFYNPSEQEKNYLSNGFSLSERAIFLNVNIKKPFTPPTRLLQLQSTAVHEYIHCLRARQKIKTLLDAIINEGVSTFIQTSLFGPPSYLDIQGTHVEDIKKWWKWWHRRYLVKPVETKISSAFLDNVGTREGGYRLGYYIVSSYLDVKKISSKQLLDTPFVNIKKFASALFN